jgi:hypothetical protein
LIRRFLLVDCIVAFVSAVATIGGYQVGVAVALKSLKSVCCGSKSSISAPIEWSLCGDRSVNCCWTIRRFLLVDCIVAFVSAVAAIGGRQG